MTPRRPMAAGQRTVRRPGQKCSPGPAGAREEQAEQEIRRLGEALLERVEDVVQSTVARTQRVSDTKDAEVTERFVQIARRSTTAVAHWLAGGNPEEGRETGRAAFETYGQLAAQRVVPLHEIAKRSLCWRDSLLEELVAKAEELELSPQALARATAMVQRTVDVTHVRMCESFESERSRTDEELASRREELAFLATHDRLTGLPNRTLILDRATQMLGRARREQSLVAALMIKIENLKAIGVTLGRSAGEELLHAIAARLDGILRDSDALGRVGEDEFVVLAADLLAGTGVELIAERLLEALKAPFVIGTSLTSELAVSASIGIACGEQASAEELLREADIAMNRAIRDGGSRYVMFESDMQKLLHRRVALEMDLHGALDRGEFFLVYQPTFELERMRLTGFEALLRWRHPERGVVQPGDFIPMLEQSGLIAPVGRWVLEQAARQAAAWRSHGHVLGVAVNVSARQLDSDEFIGHVRDALAVSELEPGALILEVTETALMANVEQTAERLAAVKAFGVRIAIDDFGSGYSSLSHLQRFPVDLLKIDRSFVAQLTDNPEGVKLIGTLVQLGRELAIETLAEGIEREEQLHLLQGASCHSGQGFLFAAPMELDAAEQFLRSELKRDVEAPVLAGN